VTAPHAQFKRRASRDERPPAGGSELDWLRWTQLSIDAERARLGLPPSRPPLSRKWGQAPQGRERR
jgi:hypothetical protein